MALAIAASCVLTAHGLSQSDWRLETIRVPARDSAGMVFDFTRGRTVVFAGANASGILTQTAIWDGDRWSFPQLAIEPPPRWSPSMSYDLATGRTILFGGDSGFQVLGDTWVWDGTSWTARLASGPSPRRGAAMVHDVCRARTVLFGGFARVGSGLVPAADTWEWDGFSWTLRTPTRSPPPTDSPMMAYDLLHCRTVLFRFESNEIWTWDGSNWTSQPMPAGPSMRWGAATTYDLNTGRVLLFGGVNSVNGSDLNDLWSWDGSSWLNLGPSGLRPPARHTACLVADVARARIVLHCGIRVGIPFADTWEWNGSSWSERTIVLPSTRTGHAAAWDDSRCVGVMFGGAGATGTLDETWETHGLDWVLRQPAQRPPARAYPGMAHDSARQRTVLFGGLFSSLSSLSVLDDTWEWNGNLWTQRNLAVHPSARFAVAMTFDSSRQCVVLFGGASYSPSTLHQDTWTYDGTAWLQLSPAHSPPARSQAAITFDRGRGRAVLFGGHASVPMADTWEWDGVDWIAQAPLTSPPARQDAVFVYDPLHALSVLSFGRTVYSVCFDDTWGWNGVDWQPLVAGTRPLPRASAAAFFDAVANRTVVFGGECGVQPFDETWTYGPVQPASIAPFGTGCAGSAGTPVLRADGGTLPWLGDTQALAVEPTPANAPVLLAIGFSNTNFGGASLPASLDALGMTGCTLLVSIDEQRLAFANGARADFALSVPTTTSLVGLPFFAQSAVADVAANAAGVVVSNALQGRIGSR